MNPVSLLEFVLFIFGKAPKFDAALVNLVSLLDFLPAALWAAFVSFGRCWFVNLVSFLDFLQAAFWAAFSSFGRCWFVNLVSLAALWAAFLCLGLCGSLVPQQYKFHRSSNASIYSLSYPKPSTPCGLFCSALVPCKFQGCSKKKRRSRCHLHSWHSQLGFLRLKLRRLHSWPSQLRFFRMKLCPPHKSSHHSQAG